VHGEDNTLCTINITDTTKIKGSEASKNTGEADSLVPGLYIQANGKGNEKNELVATAIKYNATSLRTLRQVDARAAIVETRVGAVEQRSENLDYRTGQLETRTTQLDEQGKQTQGQLNQVQEEVNQARTETAQSEQRINSVSQRVSDLDRYNAKYSEVVYFSINSSVLGPADKQKLDKIAQEAKAEKGYSLEVAGYADKTGYASYTDRLSEARALAVIQYLQEQADVPLYRILAPAGLGASHAAANNHTRAGRKLNRRVEVTILVNQGVAGSNQAAENSTPTISAAK
jgi:outer membrane protein OmpA-like peptidoglycan-associated protein